MAQYHMTPARYHTVCDIIFRSDLQLQILCASAVTFCMQEKLCCHILGEEQDLYKQILLHFCRQWFKNLQSYPASCDFSIIDNLKGQENYKIGRKHCRENS